MSTVSRCLFLFQAFRKFDEMNGKLTEQLRKLAKQVVNLLAPLIFYLFIMHGSLLYFLGIYLILRSVYETDSSE